MDIDLGRDSHLAIGLYGNVPWSDDNIVKKFWKIFNDAPDVYAVIYHPDYKKIIQLNEKELTLEELLVYVHESVNEQLLPPVNMNDIPLFVRIMLLESKYNIQKFSDLVKKRLIL